MADKRIYEPTEGEYVGVCHYSHTGWAIWKQPRVMGTEKARADWSARRWCTCRPALAPEAKP